MVDGGWLLVGEGKGGDGGTEIGDFEIWGKHKRVTRGCLSPEMELLCHWVGLA